ncbi:MAG: hypothetical protein V4751_05555 [Pseudomonadota bacterium]
MSLVNDMLRDLDQQRRGTSGTGVGAERLVPVSSTQSSSSNLKTIIAVVVLLLLAGAVAILGLQYFRQPAIIQPMPVQPAPVAVSPVVATPVEPAPVATVAPTPTQEELELAMIVQRMEELEAQNRALLEAQAQLTAAATAATSPVQTVTPSSPVVDTSLAVAAPGSAMPSPVLADADIDPAFANALAVEPSVANPSAVDVPAAEQAAIASAQSTADQPLNQEPAAPMRSPTILSFDEQDKALTQEALTLWGRNQRAQSVALLQEFINANPLAHQSRETLIKLMLQQNDMAAVTTLVQDGLSVAPRFVGYRKLQARLLLSSGKAAEAAQLLAGQEPSVSVDNEYHDLLATARLSSLDFAGAATSYEALVQQNRNEARWWYGLAAAWDGQGRGPDALQAYEQALALPSLSAGLRQRSQQRVIELGR